MASAKRKRTQQKKKQPDKKAQAVGKLEAKTYGVMTNTENLKEGGISRTRRKVAIVGFADSSMREVMPLFDDEDFEIWPLNQLYMKFPEIVVHATRWFQIHSKKSYDHAARDHKHSDWLALQRAFPIYMQGVDENIPMSVRFPMQSIMAKFGDYFTNSISWMIALAIYEGFEEIHVYGVDMAQDDEYCLGENTCVLTADLRWVRLGDVQEGDELIGFDEDPGPKAPGAHAYRQWRVASVTHTGRVTLPCYRLKLTDGTEFIASENHPWLTHAEHENRWRLTKELDTPMHRADRPTKIVKVVDIWEEAHTWEAGYLAAAFDGEGHVTQSEHQHCNGHGFRIGFSQIENPMSEKVRDCLDALTFAYSEGLNESIINFNLKGGRSELMRFLGQVRPRRLLENFDASVLGSMQRKDAVAVESAEFIGDHEVVALQTSTKTFIAEGFATHNTEQRPSVEFFLGIIWGINMAHRQINEQYDLNLPGMRLYVPDNCDLLKAFWLYPFEDDVAFESKIRMRMDELQGRAAHLASQEQGARDMRMQLLGARDNMRYIRRNWRGQIREMRMLEGGKRPRVSVSDGTIINEEEYQQQVNELRKRPN